MSATSRSSVLSTYGETAVALGLWTAGDAEAAAARLLRWLRETSQPWLVVLDDVLAPAVMDGLWPRGPAGRTLATAASQGALGLDAVDPDAAGLDAMGQGTLPDGHRATVIGVGTFTAHQSLGYLMRRLTADLDQRQGVVDLVPQLGSEPLALTQASAVIASSELTCHGYLGILASRQARQATGAASSPAAATWAIAVEQADALSSAAHSQLIVSALLDGNGVPGAIFSEAARLHKADEKTSQQGLDSAEAAGLLSVDRSSPAALTRMNWIVAAAIRAATPPDMLAATAVAAADMLAAAWPDDDARDLGRVYRSCTDRLHRLGKEALWQDGCHRVLLRAGQSLEVAGLVRCAADYWEAARRHQRPGTRRGPSRHPGPAGPPWPGLPGVGPGGPGGSGVPRGGRRAGQVARARSPGHGQGVARPGPRAGGGRPSR